MRYAQILAVTLMASMLATSVRTAESTFDAQKKPEAKVDKTLAKPTPEIQRFWITPEFLMMWSKDGPVHDVGVTRNISFWNDPTAQFIFKENDQDYGMQLGGRLTFGLWADDDRKWGFELSGFALEEKEDSFGYTGSVLNFPFYSPSFGESFIAFFSANPIKLEITSESQLWGVEGLGIHNFKRGKQLSLDAVFGIKHVNLSEDFKLRWGSTPFFKCKDSFETENQFFGAKLGAKLSYTAWDRLLIDVQPAVSLGANCEQVDVSGYSSFGSGTAFALYAGKTNIGTHKKTSFAVLPEIKVGLGCKITKNLSFNANYNFMYISDVMRPGDQITRRINLSNTFFFGPGPAALPADPKVRMSSTDYWAHGVGVNFKIQF